MNEHNDVNTASSTVSNSTTACYGYCQYRLPCGYCKEMKSTCPYAGLSYMKITCDNGSVPVNNYDVAGNTEVKITC